MVYTGHTICTKSKARNAGKDAVYLRLHAAMLKVYEPACTTHAARRGYSILVAHRQIALRQSAHRVEVFILSVPE